jgi:APA family basic amino acid/polyamine antiporter
MAGLPLLTWLRFVLWLVLGLAIYFLYGRRQSRLAARRQPAC